VTEQRELYVRVPFWPMLLVSLALYFARKSDGKKETVIPQGFSSFQAKWSLSPRIAADIVKKVVCVVRTCNNNTVTTRQFVINGLMEF